MLQGQKGNGLEHPEIKRHAPEGWKGAQDTLPLDEEMQHETECDISTFQPKREGKSGQGFWR